MRTSSLGSHHGAHAHPIAIAAGGVAGSSGSMPSPSGSSSLGRVAGGELLAKLGAAGVAGNLAAAQRQRSSSSRPLSAGAAAGPAGKLAAGS
jgi:hypothetical protein